MRKLFSLLAIATVLMSGCSSSGGSSSPSGVVNSFLTAMKEGNLDKIKTYITKSDVKMFEAGQKFAEALGGKEMVEKKMMEEFKIKSKDVSFSVKGEKVEGDTTATVDVEIKENAKIETQAFKLKKEDGVWKIQLISAGIGNFSKEGLDDVNKSLEAVKNMNLDSLKEGILKEMGEGQQQMKDVIQNVNTDSLKKVLEKLKEQMDKLETN
jgi:Domain of unknown function (DUF4878)